MAIHLSKTGPDLRAFIEAVREEYRRREPYEEYLGGVRQPNTVRLVAGQVLEEMAPDRQAALTGDLLRLESLSLFRELDEVFEASDSVGALVFDLACEVCWQLLVSDVEIRIEDEIRLSLLRD